MIILYNYDMILFKDQKKELFNSIKDMADNMKETVKKHYSRLQEIIR